MADDSSSSSSSSSVASSASYIHLGSRPTLQPRCPYDKMRFFAMSSYMYTFTPAVWNELEKENKEFFEAYTAQSSQGVSGSGEGKERGGDKGDDPKRQSPFNPIPLKLPMNEGKPLVYMFRSQDSFPDLNFYSRPYPKSENDVLLTKIV